MATSMSSKRVCKMCESDSLKESKYFIACNICCEYTHNICANVALSADTFKKLPYFVCLSCLDFSKECYENKLVDRKLTKESIFDKQVEIGNSLVDIRDDLCHRLNDLEQIKDEISVLQGRCTEIQSTQNTMIENQDKIVNKVESARELVDNLKENFTPTPNTADVTKPSSFTQVLKKGLPPSRANSLTVSCKDNVRASERVDFIGNTLKDIQIEHSKTIRSSGNIFLSFSDENEREKAVSRLETNDVLSVRRTVKLNPRIRIGRINECEDTDNKENIIKTLIERNEFLKYFQNIDSALICKAVIDIRGRSSYIIIECTPEIRAAIKKKGDKLQMCWGRYDVVDSFYVPRCFHCQILGHTSVDCKSKSQKKTCRDCSEFMDDDHHTYSSTVLCCINCKLGKRARTDHSSSDGSCPILLEKIKWIQSRIEVFVSPLLETNSGSSDSLSNYGSIYDETGRLKVVIG